MSPQAIAVAIPCYDEAAAIASVVSEWRGALPEAEIIVFDNNSRDGSGELARQAGARVVLVTRQGKGHVLQAIFQQLSDRQAVILIDGDGTYPASAVGPLLAAVLEGRADMAVGHRKPVPGALALSPVRSLGNTLIRFAFRIFIGPGCGDLLSGYRVFSRDFLRKVQLESSGFEIETELACQAVALKLRVVEFDTPYLPRAAGTSSKLRALRDGVRIMGTILKQSYRLRPARLLLILAACLGGIAASGYLIFSTAIWRS